LVWASWDFQRRMCLGKISRSSPAKMLARSITFFSSRTFPGQSCRRRDSAISGLCKIPAGLTQLLPQLDAESAVRAHEQDTGAVALVRSTLRDGRRPHRLVNKRRLWQVDEHLEWLPAPLKAGLLAANVRLGRSHAESCFRVRRGDRQVRISYHYFHPVDGS
jgi:hypothetical protein